MQTQTLLFIYMTRSNAILISILSSEKPETSNLANTLSFCTLGIRTNYCHTLLLIENNFLMIIYFLRKRRMLMAQKN